MPIALQAATIDSFEQTLGTVASLIDQAEAYCAEKALAPEALIEARLAPDMLPFGYQVKAACEHSLGAIEAVREGNFTPDRGPRPTSFDGLRQKVAATRAALAAIDPAEVEGFVGGDTQFSFGTSRYPFTSENFLLSFSLPNFYFHATTAYAILRAQGLPLGKRDFLGKMRIKA